MTQGFSDTNDMYYAIHNEEWIVLKINWQMYAPYDLNAVKLSFLYIKFNEHELIKWIKEFIKTKEN